MTSRIKASPRPVRSRWLGVAGLALLMVVCYTAASSGFILRVLALVWIMAFAAIGLHLLMGMAGQISLGHAGFFSIGAYAMAILPGRFGVPVLAAILIGALASALLAWLIGKPILRLKGHYLAIATLGFSLLVELVIAANIDWTGGPDGINVHRLVIGGARIVSPAAWYVIAAILLLAGIALSIQLRDSSSGRALRGILESEVAAASMGVDVALRKSQVFVTAAVYASLAGSALALMNGFITPDLANFMTSVQFLAMAVIGGIATPLGAVVGSAILTVLPQLLASFPDYQDIVLGLIIMLAMIGLRRGIVPTLTDWIGAHLLHRSPARVALNGEPSDRASTPGDQQ
ncbi:branched-chain amino acid ABC transporter permease (plasmid) [Paraburkholderia sp. PREW-6R]|uniref:branched-chain amino acid ABC transporter permease n=1 Tax=Paraburkholderia sp. PREW-6R TaxID=3141544 RepID=UPI0031F5BF9B